MYVCVCHGVTDRDIAQAVERGVDSFDALRMATGCGSSCGCCADYAREEMERCKAPVILPLLQAA